MNESREKEREINIGRGQERGAERTRECLCGNNRHEECVFLVPCHF